MKLISIPLFLLVISGSFFTNASDNCFGGKYSRLSSASLKLIKLDVKPRYPTPAAKDNLSGCVALSYEALSNGKISSVKVEEASPKRIFNRESIRAFKKWKLIHQESNFSGVVVFHFTPEEATHGSSSYIITAKREREYAKSDVSGNSLTDIENVISKINREAVKSAEKIAYIKQQTRVLNYELSELQVIVKIKNSVNRAKRLEQLKAGLKKDDLKVIDKPKVQPYSYTRTFKSEAEELRFLKQERIANGRLNKQKESVALAERAQVTTNIAKLKQKLNLSNSDFEKQLLAEEQALARKVEAQAELEKRKAEALAKFRSLGKCDIGNSVLHREVWDTETSSGNVIADYAFGASTKEQFIITYEAIVESFLGNKVKTIVNDYKIQQTLGGGFLNPKTHRLNELAAHADKYIGKVQFYEKSRCTL